MPTKNKVNHHAAGHAQDLADLSVATYKGILKGLPTSQADLDKLIRLANDLARELRGPVVDTSDPFLTEGPKTDVSKLPTVAVPAVEKPKEEPKKFMGIGR